MIVLAAVFFAIGLFLIIRPDLAYKMSTFFKNYSEGDPSRLYIYGTRFGGGVLIAVGIFFIICMFII